MFIDGEDGTTGSWEWMMLGECIDNARRRVDVMSVKWFKAEQQNHVVVSLFAGCTARCRKGL